jgi:hypothetical protein
VSFDACGDEAEVCWLDMGLNCPQGTAQAKRKRTVVPPLGVPMKLASASASVLLH